MPAAGSHGVWGLDDYQFLPFIWGAAQLINHPMIKPKSINNSDILATYSKEYLYLGGIQFVKQVGGWRGVGCCGVQRPQPLECSSKLMSVNSNSTVYLARCLSILIVSRMLVVVTDNFMLNPNGAAAVVASIPGRM